MTGVGRSKCLFRGVASRYFASLDDFVLIARGDVQWIAGPRLAVANTKKPAKLSGIVVVFDQNHMRNQCDPDPPPEFKIFFSEATAYNLAHGSESSGHPPLRLDLGSAAVNEQFDTRDETGVVRSKKQRHVSNFLGFPHASHRDGGHNPCNDVRRQATRL